MDFLCYRFSELTVDSGDKALLSPLELAQSARRGHHYLLSRVTLKKELARRLGCTPQDIQLELNEHGKPSLPGSPIHFNMSHSEDILCLAFHRAPIGVDIQQHRPSSASSALAKRIMCRQQLAAWEQRSCPTKEFFDCWCVAEALVKHAGTTIWQATKYPFLYHPNGIEALFETSSAIQLFSPSAGFSGAVVYTELPTTHQ